MLRIQDSVLGVFNYLQELELLYRIQVLLVLITCGHDIQFQFQEFNAIVIVNWCSLSYPLDGFEDVKPFSINHPSHNVLYNRLSAQ